MVSSVTMQVLLDLSSLYYVSCLFVFEENCEVECCGELKPFSLNYNSQRAC